MPELPEVETIVREMRKALVGKILKRVFIFDKKLSEPNFNLPLVVESVERLGKYIFCNMNKGVSCLVHLRMTGELLLERSKPFALHRPDAHKHQRALFAFTDGSLLRFIDVRRFGTIEWRKKHHPLPVLGVDPLSRDFNAQTLAAAAQKSSRAIKSLLLDQKIIAGIGNIYADEALWHAKIHPARESGTLSGIEAERFAAAIKRVLRESIKKGGFTLRDYRRLDGSSGYYQESRKVYGREGEHCFRCDAKIKRIKVGGRSSYFCQKCQRK